MSLGGLEAIGKEVVPEFIAQYAANSALADFKSAVVVEQT